MVSAVGAVRDASTYQSAQIVPDLRNVGVETNGSGVGIQSIAILVDLIVQDTNTAPECGIATVTVHSCVRPAFPTISSYRTRPACRGGMRRCVRSSEEDKAGPLNVPSNYVSVPYSFVVPVPPSRCVVKRYEGAPRDRRDSVRTYLRKYSLYRLCVGKVEVSGRWPHVYEVKCTCGYPTWSSIRRARVNVHN